MTDRTFEDVMNEDPGPLLRMKLDEDPDEALLGIYDPDGDDDEDDDEDSH
jgi:hypothetical protein